MADIEDKERYADPIDAGSALAETWMADRIAEHRYQMTKEAKQYDTGRCRNCAERLDDGRAFCDADCATDFDIRTKSDKRNAKYRGD